MDFEKNTFNFRLIYEKTVSLRVLNINPSNFMNKLQYIIIFIIFVFSGLHCNADERIRMSLEGGVYTMPCEVNGLKMRFIFDTGASTVCISMTEALFMAKNGYLEEDDFIGVAQTRIANGDIDENMIINLRFIRIGQLTIQNVKAVISNSINAPLLLGQTVIRQLGSWSIDGDYLVIHNKHVDDGSARSFYNKGIEYKGIKDYSQAILFFEKAAQMGYAKAEYELALCYHFGLGIDKNLKKAAYWYNQASLQGETNSQYNLGYLYEKGQGVTQDYANAVYWYREAAVQGHTEAQFKLGVCYDTGLGIEQNFQEAAKWNKRAAEQGHITAQYNMGLYYLSGQGVQYDKSLAKQWLQKAAENGNEKARQVLKKIR